MKGIRKNLKIPPTFIDRTWTNQKVFEEANAKIREGSTHSYMARVLKVRPITEYIYKKKLQLLGHIIRCNNKDPLRQVTFADHRLTPLKPALRRVGRPRDKWVDDALRKAWRICREPGDTSEYSAEDRQIDDIWFAAQWKMDPFTSND